MGTSVGNLFVELSLEASTFINGLKDAQKEAKEMEKTLKPLKQAAEDLGKTFAVAGGIVTTAFIGMVKASADYGEQINKAGIQTGVMTEKLSALKYLAEQEETSFETLSKGLKTMSANANLNSDAFKQLGIKVTDAHGQLRPMDSILVEVAQRMSTLADGTTKNAIASEIFGGKMGQELIPLLNRLGKEGLGPAQEQVRKLGLEMSGDAAHAADDFNDSVKEIEDAVLGLSNAVASALIPGLTDTSHSLRDAIEEAKDFAKEHEGLTKAIALTGVALTGAGGFLLGLAGIVTIGPKVVAGLEGIAAGITKIGYVSSAAATVGLAAIIYWAEEVIRTEADLSKTHREIAATTQQANDLIMQQWDRLEKIGVVVNRGALSWDEFGKAVARATLENLPALQKSYDATKKASDGIHILTKAEEEQIKVDAKWRAANAEIYREQVKNAADFVEKWIAGFEKTSTEADKFTDSIDRQDVATSKLAETSVDAAVVIAGAMVRAHDAWDAADEKTMTSNAKLFNELNGLRETDVDNQVKVLTERVKVEQKMADQTAQAWKNAMANLATRVGESFADMVVNMKFSAQGMVSIAKNVAKEMLSAIISGFISPATSALGALGKTLAGAIGFGGGGIGGAAAGAAGTAGTAAATGGTGGLLGSGAGSIGLFGLSGAATLGIGAAALAVGLIAKHYIGKGRRTADDFTSNVQNQFGSDLAEVSAHGTVADLDALWAQFNKDANQFASQGDTEQKVVNQAHQTLDSLVAQVRRDVGARDAANQVNITVNPAPNMDINQLVNEIIRQLSIDSSARSQLQAALA